MDTQTTALNLHTVHTILHERAIHPELFEITARRTVGHGRYELDAWAVRGGHVLRFTLDGRCVSEIVTDRNADALSHGSAAAFPCAGEHELDRKLPRTGVTYMTSIQSEQLSEVLYRATYEEIEDLAREVDGLVVRWADPAGPCMTLIDTQRLAREVHVQTYHLSAAGGVVLRTQTIFEHA
jgi:hypothetical protein